MQRGLGQPKGNPMNTLQIIREKQAKRARLSEAQCLMAKAYRGVDYTDLKHDRPKKDRKTDLAYRGIHYSI